MKLFNVAILSALVLSATSMTARADSTTCKISKVSYTTSQGVAMRCEGTPNRFKVSVDVSSMARFESLLLAAALSGRSVFLDSASTCSSATSVCEAVTYELQP
jgi:hypothetical protein